MDTERISDAALGEALASFGRRVDDDLLAALLGRPWPANWTLLQQRLGLDDEDGFRAAYRDAFRTRFRAGAELFDDAVRTARALVDEGLPLAVATSSTRRHLEAVLDLGVRDLFSATVAFEDTTEHKPGPAPYVRACELLGVEPATATGIEDSPVGVAAVRAAGMRTVAVARPGTDRASLREAHVVVDLITPGVVLDVR